LASVLSNASTLPTRLDGGTNAAKTHLTAAILCACSEAFVSRPQGADCRLDRRSDDALLMHLGALLRWTRLFLANGDHGVA